MSDREYLSSERVQKAVNSVSVIEYFEYLRNKGVVRLLDNKLHGVAKKDLYYAPNDNSAKYSVCKDGFFDFKSDVKGQIINAVMLFENLDWYNSILFLEKFSGNIQYLNQKTQTEETDIINQVKSKVDDDKEATDLDCRITGIFKPNNETLLEYFKSRGISKDIVMEYLKQVHFEQYQKDGTLVKMFGFGIKNVAGGYSLRTNQMKTIVGAAGYSHIQKGEEPANKLVVVEGMTEVLSYVSLAKQQEIDPIQTDFVCLNSVVHTGKFVEDLNTKKLPHYKNIYLLLNGDRVGNRATFQLKQMLAKRTNIRVNDIRGRFDIGKNYVDLNDFLNSNKTMEGIDNSNLNEEETLLVDKVFQLLSNLNSNDLKNQEYEKFVALFNDLVTNRVKNNILIKQ